MGFICTRDKWITLILPIVAAVALSVPGALRAEDSVADGAVMTSLLDMPLESLMMVEVTSVSRKNEKQFESGAAVYVITGEDIQRSGATSVVEALRLAPGVHVARIDVNKWAVSIRGFNDRFSNKLLVLQDGRTIYTPHFSGVYWNMHDIMLEDIDRIEVIRGAGSTLWGANAVNGVINIVTKGADATHGGLVTVGGGIDDRGTGAVRYGGKAGEALHYRTYGRYFNRTRENSVAVDGLGDSQHKNSDWRGGFRLDWVPPGRNMLTVQGDVYDTATPYELYNGANFLTRWNREISGNSSLHLQAYYDFQRQRMAENPDTKHREERHTLDIELQHNYEIGDWQSLVWGGNVRVSADKLGTNQTIFLQPLFLPREKTELLWSLFVQDEITLSPQLLKLVLGMRLEHNDYTGAEYQPTARLILTPNGSNTIWAAVTRGVRTPSRAESGILTALQELPPGALGDGTPAAEVRMVGNSAIKSEEMVAYELGYRHSPVQELIIDMALFYNDYRKLTSAASGESYLDPSSGRLVLPYLVVNGAAGQSYGGEVSIGWRPAAWLQMDLSYAHLQVQVQSEESGELQTSILRAGTSPRHQASWRTALKLGHDWKLDLWLRYVGALKQLDVDEYVAADVRLAWTPIKSLELSLTGQNLVGPPHYEFSSDMFGNPATRTCPTVFGAARWKF